MTIIKKIFRFIRAKRFLYKPLVQVILSKQALLHNVQVFKELEPQKQIAPVLKSNAYGHGLVGVAKQLDGIQAPFLVVDSYYEALILKNEGIKTNLLVIGYTFVENIIQFSHPEIIFCITTLAQAQELSQKLKIQKRFHIKIDTGMHRQGILPTDIPHVIELIQKNKNIILEGICSHLADADTKQSELNKKQIRVWNEQSARIKKEFPSIRYTHIEATAGTAYAHEIDANMTRIGLGLYGIDSGIDRNLNVQPVLRMESIVVGIKKIKKGEGVGYNFTYTAPHDMTIGVVPAGYFEGIPRALSNNGYVKIKNVYCPIVGRVSMNMMSINVSQVPAIREGDTVEIISNNSNDKNSIISMARTVHIPYEILVKIPEKIRRVWE